MANRKLITDRERFFKHFKKDSNGCWIWQLFKDRGYGRFRVGSLTDGSRSYTSAHRWAYEEFVGEIPSGLVIDHLCRNPSCVNPDHLDVVTPRENTQRGLKHTKLYCFRGHRLFGENLYLNKRRDGSVHRQCLMCHKMFQTNNLEKYRIAQANRRANWTDEQRERERKRQNAYDANNREKRRLAAKQRWIDRRPQCH